MRNAVRCMLVLLILSQVVLTIAACGSAVTPEPTAPPVSEAETKEPSPSSAVVVATTTLPTPEPTALPTAEPTEAEPTDTPAPEEVDGPPTSPEQMPRISVEELKALMDSGERIAVVDVRPKESFDLGHIAGAISFPWKSQLTMGDVELLPMSLPMVTYCDCGEGEADSADVAFQLLSFGVQDVKVLAHPAIEGWIEAGYPSQ